jgi:hypothetical protein
MKNIINLAALILGLIMFGCSSNKELRTIDGYNGKVASKKVDGVNIITKVDYWNGSPQVKRYVTPVHVIIDNNSGKPLKISYEQFSLLAPDGQRFSVLPLFGISGTISKPVLIHHYNPILNPGFGYHDFWIAPFYSAIYPGIPVMDGDFYFDPLYYDNYYNYWDHQTESELPTDKMIDDALPEGVLKNGGEISGFLYFEKLDDTKANRVDFKAVLINSKTGNRFAVISIPFEVVDKK